MQAPFLASLPLGKDLLESITAAFRERSIENAAFFAIGAVRDPVLAYYDQHSKEYRTKELRGEFEIVSCMGNVSQRDGSIFVHAHIVVAADDFHCVGGHLMTGTKIFVAELHGIPVPGNLAVRRFDESTGLFLWTES